MAWMMNFAKPISSLHVIHNSYLGGGEAAAETWALAGGVTDGAADVGSEALVVGGQYFVGKVDLRDN